jgi:hypothetical protein
MGFVARVCQPSALRMLCPEASSAQNIIAAVSADGSTVWVLIRRLNSSCNRSIALVVRRRRHWLGGRRAKANERSPASSKRTPLIGPQRLALPFRRPALRRGQTGLRPRDFDRPERARQRSRPAP